MKRFTLCMIVLSLALGCSGPGKDPDKGGGHTWPDMGTGNDDDMGVGAYDVGTGPVDTYYLDCPPDKAKGGGGGGGYCPKPDMCIPKWCGDGVINPYEQCDGTNLQGKSCVELGYDGGTLSCKINCTYDTSGCYKCGNGKLEGNEECDGKAFGKKSCKSFGFGGGKLKCKSDCTIDKTTCTLCGNNKRDNAELCDGIDLGGKTCKNLGFAWGALACTKNCFFDTSGCKNNKCGDGKVWGAEECDGKNLDGKTCSKLGYGKGTLACNSNCTFDTAGCHKCGDGKRNGKEQCEGADLGGKSCKSFGYAGGALKCTKKCTLDKTGCSTCGDNKINKGEQCDGVNLGGATCKSKKFDYGTLKCKACKYDLTGCGLLKCGDGKITGMEQCDGKNLNGKTCKKLGFKGGTLKCQGNCMLDATGCTICGDGKIDKGEQCDKAALGGKTCKSFGFDYGTLACKSSCTYDLSGCAKHQCGDGKVTGKEQCDGVNLSGKSCKALGYTAGTLACNSNCTFNKAGCTKCGDGKIAGYEQCEGNYLGGKTCKSLGYHGGTLSCYSNCKFNKSACTWCGDNKIQAGEQCDRYNLNGWSCNKLGYHGGKLRCYSNCTLNKSSCTNCGNGVINGGEQCDTSQLGGKTCASFGYKGGTLKCYSNCVYNKTGCHRCGDNVIQSGEQCDRYNLGGKTCKSLGYTAGTLKCSSSCTFNKAYCTTCGNGKLESGEKCDGAALGGKTCKSLGFAGGTLKCGIGCAFDTTGCYKLKTLKDDTYADFSKGGLSGAGAKIYASAKGNVQLLDRLDLNQDGHNDLVFGNSFDGSITKLHSYIYWGAATGYTNKLRSGLPTLGARGAAAADLNADGHMDLVFANHREINTMGNAYVYKTYKVNSYVYWGYKTAGSTTGYSASNRAELPSPGGTGASVADLNADGHLDIVITGAHDDKTHKVNSHIYWGSAAGLNAANNTALPSLGANASAVADLNGDGRLDVVIANGGDGKAAKVDSYIYWDSAAGFSAANRSNLAGLAASDVSVADLNGDGHLDIVLANRGAGVVTKVDSYIYWGSASGFSAKPTGLPTAAATGCAVADLNGDGHLDIAFSNGGIFNAKSFIYWGSATGFSTAKRTALPTSGAGGVLAADLNKDGHADVVFANLTNGPVWAVKSDIYWGSASGFSASNKTGLPTIGARSVFGGEPGAVAGRGATHVFTSRAMDTGVATPAYTTLAFTATTPKGTTLRLQLRSASTLAGLKSAKWYGPTAVGGYYTAGAKVSAVHQGHRYIQYRAELTSDFGNTPVLDKVAITYH